MSKLQISSIYDKIISDDDARACKSIPESACKEVPGNFVKMILAQFLTKIGDALINPKVTLPWILQSLGAPAYLIGWLVPIREAGSLLPQLAIASYIRTLPIRKWTWIAGSVLQALAMFAIALSAFYLEGATAGWTIIVFLILFSFSRGLTSVAAKDVLGKTIPKSQRGQVNGLSTSSAGFVTLILAILMMISTWFNWQAGHSFYAISLAVAGFIWLAASFVFAQITEYPGEVDGGKNGLLEAIKQLSLLKTDRAFRHFVATRTLFLCTALSAPYYVVLSQTALGNQIWLLAFFMFASGLASFVSGPFWGRFSDRSSKQVMVIGSSLSAVVGVILFLSYLLVPSLLSTAFWLPLLYFVVCIAHDGVRVGRKTYLVDLADGNKRTSYVAVSNTVIGVMLLLVSLLGALVSILGIHGLVLLFSFITFCGVAMAKGLPDVSR
ncbi:MFS transporter [Vibrio sp. RC27]